MSALGLPDELEQAIRQRLKRHDESLVPLRRQDGACAECESTEEHEPGCIFKKLEQEVQEASNEWVEVVAKLPLAQAAYDKAYADEDKYDDYDKFLPEKVMRRTDHARAALFGWMDRKVVLENSIRKLLSSAEHDRRREVSNRLREVRRVASNNSKKQTARDQGVPGTYLGAGGNFKPGMDARYKSDLITSALGEKIGPKGLHQYTKENALERLAQRGWMPHFEKAKASREKKAAAKAAKEKAKATPRKRSTRASTTKSSRTAGKKKA